MNCEYCGGGSDYKDLFVRETPPYVYGSMWVYLHGSDLQIDVNSADTSTAVIEINYCPMCGSKLGDSDD